MEYFKRYSLLIICILYLSIAIVRLSFPELDHGDEFTDANVLIAGENFVKFGFINSRFLPIFKLNLNKPTDAYTHYPPLTENFNGLLRMIFRTDSIYLFRAISLLFSFFNILFWYLFIKKISNSYLVVFLSTIFYISNPLFIFGIDSLHESCYSDFFRSLIIFIFLIMIKSAGKKRKYILFLLWILLVLESLSTFEYIVYLSLFFILFREFFKDRGVSLSRKEIFVLLSAPVFAFLLHFFQNIWYFEDFWRAFEDLRDIFITRISKSRDAPPMDFIIWLRYVILRNFSLVFMFNFFILILCAFFSYLLYHKLSLGLKEEINYLFRLWIIFGICGISWYIIFPSHSWAHTFVLFLARHLVPFVVIGFTIFSYIIFSFIKENFSIGYYPMLFLCLIIGVIIFNGIINSELPVTRERIIMYNEFIKFKKCLLELKELSSQSDEVGINYYRYPFIQYYLHRHCLPIFNKDSLEKLKVLPSYFIFIVYNNPNSQQLLEYLEKRYVYLWKCESLRFPAIFFKLKNNE